MPNPLVSVCVITYNHLSYIRQSLESVAMQKINFDMELIIADDCSKDGTSQVVENFLETYKGTVNYLKREKNFGAADNFIDMLSRAKGKYVAYMEGDDYWSNPEKLQMQIDFLEKNQSISLSSHNSIILNKDGSTLLFNRDKRYSSGPHDAIYTAEDYIVRDFFHSSAIVYRKSALPDFPDWYKNSFGGDYFLVLFLGMHGDFHYINEPLSVYRIHDNSISTYSSRYEIFKNFDLHFKKFDEYSGFRYHKKLAGKIFSFRYNFFYYHPNYFTKIWFFFSNLRSIFQMSTSVISPLARLRMLVPTYFLKSKVNLFTKKEA
jgi:glycosyltransferase involved in cell wall biosynthesis